MRPLCIVLALAVLASPRTVSADTVQAVSDKTGALTLRLGFLQTEDDLFHATWLRPAMLGGSCWLMRVPRTYMNGLQIYGLASYETASISYHEKPQVFDDQLTGIYRADIGVDYGLVLGLGARLSLYDDGRFHVSGFADMALPAWTPEARIHSLVVSINGLQIDVAKAVEQHAVVTFEAKTYRVGGTVGMSFGPPRLRWTPYLTFGWLHYGAQISFAPDDKLASALKAFGVSAAVLSPRQVIETNAFFAPGLRLDFGPDWSLESQALIGRYDGTWVIAGLVGVAWRFGPSPPH